MKILLTADVSGKHVSGVGISVENLAAGLRARGHEVKLLLLSETYRSAIKDDTYLLPSANLSFIYPSARQPLLPSFKRIVRALIKWSPDIIHTNSEFFVFSRALVIARVTHAPIIHTYHTMWGEPEYLKYLRGILTVDGYIKILHMRMRRVAALIAPTEKTRDCLLSYDLGKKISVIPSGINFGRLQSVMSESGEKELKSRYGITESDRVIVFVGRIGKEKNIEETLRYAGELNAEDRRYKLLIIGGGPYLDGLRETVVNLDFPKGFCIFTGFVPNAEIGSYFRLGGVFSTASTSETQGITYIEAMTCGVPVVCRKDAATENLVINGETGFAYTNYAEFRKFVTELFDNAVLRESICENARKKAGEYSIEKFAESVERVYYENINSRQR